MAYYRSTAYRISQGFQKVHICYFMAILWITMHFQSSSMKSVKTKEKENRSCTGNPSFSKNHATVHKQRLRIRNSELFLIRTRGPSSWQTNEQRPNTNERQRYGVAAWLHRRRTHPHTRAPRDAAHMQRPGRALLLSMEAMAMVPIQWSRGVWGEMGDRWGSGGGWRGCSGASPHSQTEEKARWRWQQWRWVLSAWSPRSRHTSPFEA